MRAVARHLQLVVGDVEDVVEGLPADPVEEPAVELGVDVPGAPVAHPVGQPAGGDEGDALDRVAVLEGLPQRHAELEAAAQARHRRDGAVLQDRDQRQRHVGAQALVDADHPVVQAQLVGERRFERPRDEPVGQLAGQRRMAGHLARLQAEPALHGCGVLLAHPHAELGEVLQEEVREVLVGHQHHGLAALLVGAVGRPGQAVEEPAPLSRVGGITGREHHRCVR